MPSGAMLLDTATIDLVYIDATPSLSATVIDASITEAKLSLSDVTTKDASTTAHGLLAQTQRHGDAVPRRQRGVDDAGGGWGHALDAESGHASTLATGLLAFWRMEEASGNRVDSVGGMALVPQGTVATITNAAGKKATPSP